MSFFEKLFPKKKPDPFTSLEEELAFLQNLLTQSFSKTYLVQSLKPRKFVLKEETSEEMVYQGQFGFFLCKFNEDLEIYHFLYTDLSGETHLLVEGDHHQYGRLTFKKDEETGEHQKG